MLSHFFSFISLMFSLLILSIVSIEKKIMPHSQFNFIIVFE